ncbi:Galactose/methyl galactoside import ATP-binding protein MglA [Roseimaritima multifibrata]|uniref:Galactose/methyl galactoside import ATP-binding protein MglA n=1 Tax=Roseimaritima multifibrata TaxID=1930274 RepID=A0A517MDH2_9BACT|nr:sugar ABC transporter ATP-binding protein [Roseimaritima multifibrata]QDS92932.1 Galactose/methyl galactoside import ATP-binding protein MglA [Roseimaritima multifibrata]
MSTELLQVSNVCKRFGPTEALRNVSLTVRAGEVLALIGENGAGKSTLLKVLSGAHFADRGQMKIDGKDFRPAGPADARRQGVGMIYQELNLAPELSVEDNLQLGQGGFGLLLRHRDRPQVREALQTVGLSDLDPRAIVGEQSVATQQLVEIARALVSNARIILFDEPTSSLPQADVARLFDIIRKLKDRGIGIVYISHFLEEVRDITDTYSVLRDGQNVGDGSINDISDDQIVSLMVGRDVKELYPAVPHSVAEPWIEIQELSGNPTPQNVSLQLHRGEVFGVAGLVGAGRTELLRTLFGLDSTDKGKILVHQRVVGNSVRARRAAGFGFLSEDRKGEGLAQDLSILENITLGALQPYSCWGWLNLRKRHRSATEWMKRMEVKAASATQPVSQLSGGNQQKVALARILHQGAELLLLDEPTKGIDVGTKAEIYRMIGNLAAEGKTVVFVSSYLPELLAVCDRIGVMARGEVREVRDAADWTADEIMTTAVALGTDTI